MANICIIVAYIKNKPINIKSLYQGCRFSIMSGRARPIEKFAQAAAQCSTEAAAYGKCVVADYNGVQKDMCAKEFMRLKDCFLAASKKK